MQRRTFMKAVGVAGAAGAAGVGLQSLTGTAEGAKVSIEANSASVTNDRGDLAQVTIDPSIRVDWDDLDQAVGKVFIAIEGTTPDTDGYYPLFRTTPWLISNDGNGNRPASINGAPQHVDYSKPGTTGYYEVTTTLSQALTRAGKQREDTTPGPVAENGVRVVTEAGRPNYGDVTFDTGSLENYLDGNSIGNTVDDVIADVDADYVESYGGTDILQNGYYGAAADTSEFDSNTDGESNKTTVSLRYTVGLYAVDQSILDTESDAVGEGWLEYVQEDDVETDGDDNSVLVMNGEDGYPDVTEQGQFDSPATNDLSQLQAIAGSHPAVAVAEPDFEVTVTNEESSSSTTIDSGAEASGRGQ